VGAKNDGGERLTAMFKADMILHMRKDYVVFHRGPYTVFADNSICLNRRAIQVV